MLPLVISTADGSHSLLNESLNETYHSVHGAIQESRYVFVEQGFKFVLERYKPTTLSILEVGFGTGLNVLLTLAEALGAPTEIHYTTLENNPLPEEVWSQLNYGERLQMKSEFSALHQSAWETPLSLAANFQLLKRNSGLEKIFLEPTSFDLVYYDAFAPNKQPELWTRDMLTKIMKAMKPGGVLVTYCAKGQLKRDLKALNLLVETLPGPPGKKEMTRAIVDQTTV